MEIDLSDLFIALGAPSEFTAMLKAEVDQKAMVLEAGCGTGKFGISLATTHGCTVFLLDSDRDAIARSVRILRAAEDIANQRFSVVYRQGDLLRLPYPDGLFDLVFNEGVIEHFREPMLPLLEMCRASKKSVAVITPNWQNAEQLRQAALQVEAHKGTDHWSSYETLIPETTLRAYFEQAGLTDIQAGYLMAPSPTARKEEYRHIFMVGRKP